MFNALIKDQVRFYTTTCLCSDALGLEKEAAVSRAAGVAIHGRDFRRPYQGGQGHSGQHPVGV